MNSPPPIAGAGDQREIERPRHSEVGGCCGRTYQILDRNRLPLLLIAIAAIVLAIVCTKVSLTPNVRNIVLGSTIGGALLFVVLYKLCQSGHIRFREHDVTAKQWLELNEYDVSADGRSYHKIVQNNNVDAEVRALPDSIRALSIEADLGTNNPFDRMLIVVIKANEDYEVVNVEDVEQINPEEWLNQGKWGQIGDQYYRTRGYEIRLDEIGGNADALMDAHIRRSIPKDFEVVNISGKPGFTEDGTIVRGYMTVRIRKKVAQPQPQPLS